MFQSTRSIPKSRNRPVVDRPEFRWYLWVLVPAVMFMTPLGSIPRLLLGTWIVAVSHGFGIAWYYRAISKGRSVRPNLAASEPAYIRIKLPFDLIYSAAFITGLTIAAVFEPKVTPGIALTVLCLSGAAAFHACWYYGKLAYNPIHLSSTVSIRNR